MRLYGEQYPTVNQTLKPSHRAPLIPLSEQPKKKWPKWAEYVAKKRQDGEIGVGDTLERMFRSAGGSQFKLLTKRLGINCGCTDRQDHFNRIYPYRLDI